MKESEKEADRWFRQALNDYYFVDWIKKEGKFFDKGCFISQQAGEKALKACLYALGKRRIIGHSLYEMVQGLIKYHKEFENIANEARRLDRYYIPTRYPNGLPGGTPYELYDENDLNEAEDNLKKIIDTCSQFLEERGYELNHG